MRSRWRSYGKLQRELAHLARKDDPRERAEQRKVWIQRAKTIGHRSGSGWRTTERAAAVRRAHPIRRLLPRGPPLRER